MDTNNDNFDPTSLGAIPQDDFDPTSIGAKPYQEGMDMGNSAAVLGATNTVNERLASAQADASQAQQMADEASSPMGIAKETLKGLPQATAEVALDPAAKVTASVVRSPMDIIRGLFGMKPMASRIKLPSGAESGTIQNEFADKVNQVEQGTMTPLQATAGTVGETVGGATDLLGLEAGAKGLYKAGKPIAEAVTNKLLQQDAKSAAKPSLFSKMFGKKTEAQILSTPETELHKLNANERQFYFDKQKEAIVENSSTASAKVKKELSQSLETSQSEAEKLNRDLSIASRDEVIKLRPKIRESLGKQSAEYRRLVSEELAPHKDTKVNGDELKSFIENRYAENPELAQVIKNKLGIAEDLLPSKKGELPTIQRGKDTTIEELYNKTQSLKQEIGTPATKGTRVYTADEKMTDDAISTLSEFMKSKGVDLIESRRFWARYAPIRDQLVSEAKPFLQAETKTKTFANTLTRVAQGNDVNNENFIKETEKLLGSPIAQEQKAILAKLSANEKSMIASKIEAETKQANIQLQKELAEKKLDSKKFAIEQAARHRAIVKKIILAAGGLGADKIIKKYTGYGI